MLGLDFEHDPDVVRVQRAQPLLQLVDIFGVPNERISKEISVAGDEGQVSDILVCQGGEPQFRIWKIDPLLRGKLGAARPRVGNLHGDLLRIDGAD